MINHTKTFFFFLLHDKSQQKCLKSTIIYLANEILFGLCCLEPVGFIHMSLANPGWLGVGLGGLSWHGFPLLYVSSLT